MRVGVILDAGDGIVKFLGFGTMLSEEIPPQSITGIPNPKIQLDNGKIVWGYECKWDIAEDIKAYLQYATKVLEVDIDEERRHPRPRIEKTIAPVTPRKVIRDNQTSVVLIGPIRTGKTTIAKQLSTDLSWPTASLDEHGSRYFGEIGYDAETARRLTGAGQDGRWKYDLKFYPHAIKRILEDYGRGHIIDFGGRHSLFEDAQMLDSVRNMLNPYPHVVLVLPSPDLDESLRILDERRGMRHLLYGFDANALMLTHASNYALARYIHFNHGKSSEESSREIIEMLSMK